VQTDFLQYIFQAINNLLTQNLGFFDTMGQNLFRMFATILVVWYGVKSALSAASGKQPFQFDNFASLLLTISFGFAMVNYYNTPIPGVGTSFHNLITDEAQFLSSRIDQAQLQNAVGELAVEEEERLREIVLNRVAVSAVIQRAKLREKIFRFSILRFVFEVVVVDGLGAAQIVDADDEGAEVLKGADRPQINQRQGHANHGEQREGNLEIGVRHHWVSARFEIEALCVMECVIAVHQNSLATAAAAAAGASSKAADEPPAVPLKM